ncbi:MAG: hypothetical protein KIG91_03260 [Treponema sp.]|nr:hypothetical protein [Treponema sp.]
MRTWKYAETVGKKNIAEVSDPSFSCREQTAWRPAVRLYLYGSYFSIYFPLSERIMGFAQRQEHGAL